jgi:hypothetical protein
MYRRPRIYIGLIGGMLLLIVTWNRGMPYFFGTSVAMLAAILLIWAVGILAGRRK